LALDPQRGPLVFDAEPAPGAPAAAPPELLFEAPIGPPLELEAAAAVPDIRRLLSTSAATAESSPGVFAASISASAPPVSSLPLARAQSWQGETPTERSQGGIQQTGRAAPGGPVLARTFAPPLSGVSASGGVQRAAESPGAESGGGDSGTAIGEIRAADDPAKAEQDLDKLTEKVWQRIRRTLQLERERRRGLP
jgi:hypothetical protein